MATYSISIEGTSNPAIKKFQADQFLVNHNSYEFKNIDEAGNSPLAQQLFYLPFVKTVYIAQNFVAIEKYNIVDWIDIQDEVANQIAEFLNDNGKKCCYCNQINTNHKLISMLLPSCGKKCFDFFGSEVGRKLARKQTKP